MNFIRYVYPQIMPGASHRRPELPRGFIRLYATTPIWNVTSADERARYEYWEVDVDQIDHSLRGKVLTQEQVDAEIANLQNVTLV